MCSYCYLMKRFSYFTVLMVFFLLSSCTTQNFEPPGKTDAVYRIKVENTSDLNVTYSPEVSFYYVNRKESFEVPDSTIAPGESAHLIAETKEGAFGVSVDVEIRPIRATMQLTLEKGTGTGENFELDEVVETKESNFIVFIRYGEVY